MAVTGQQSKGEKSQAVLGMPHAASLPRGCGDWHSAQVRQVGTLFGLRNYMNDSLRTDVFVRFPPESIACACIYLAARTLEVSAHWPACHEQVTVHMRAAIWMFVKQRRVGGGCLLFLMWQLWLELGQPQPGARSLWAFLGC